MYFSANIIIFKVLHLQNDVSSTFIGRLRIRIPSNGMRVKGRQSIPTRKHNQNRNFKISFFPLFCTKKKHISKYQKRYKTRTIYTGHYGYTLIVSPGSKLTFCGTPHISLSRQPVVYLEIQYMSPRLRLGLYRLPGGHFEL